MDTREFPTLNINSTPDLFVRTHTHTHTRSTHPNIKRGKVAESRYLAAVSDLVMPRKPPPDPSDRPRP